MGGNVRRRHAGKNNRPKTSNRHEVDNQIQSEGDNSIQGEDVKLEKSRKNRRSPSPRQPTKQRCGNCCVAMAVLLLVLASSAVYVYNYVDTAPLIAPVRIQTAIWLDILQRDLALVWSNFFNETPPPTDREPGKEDTKDVREERGAPSEDKGSGEEGGGSGAVRGGKRTERAAEQDEAEEIPKNDEETLEKAEREVVGVEGAADVASESDQGQRSAASDEEDPSLDEREADTYGTVSPDAEDIELKTVPSSDSIEKTERETVPSSDSIENVETETVPTSDTIENVETETVPTSDTIENTEKETVPSSDTIENTEQETVPSSNSIEKTEQEALSSSDNIEHMKDEEESPIDDIEQSEEDGEPPGDNTEHLEEDGEPPSDNIEQLEEDGEPPNDNIEQLEEDGEPPSDNIEQLEDEREQPSDDIEHSEDEGEPPSDDTEHSEDEGDPPSDDIEQLEEDGEPPSDDIEQLEEDGEPPSDDIEHSEAETEPPSDDIENFEEEEEQPSDNIEQTEQEAGPLSDKDEHSSDIAGEKESVSMKSQERNGEDAELGPHDQHAESRADKFVNQENENAAAKSREQTSKPGSTPGRYKNAHITNQADFEIREKLDAGDKLLEQKQLKDGRTIFEQLLSLHPQSPRATYGRALALDLEADMYRSNALLEQAITEYLRVLDLPDVPKALIIQTGHKCASRQTFRGWVHRAVRTLQKVVTLFPEELDLWSELGVEYLIQGSNERAREAFLHVLQHRPDDGFAKVHLGFIIKVADRNYNKSIPFLQQGIDSGVPGTIDGRFFLHLGDALYRVGRHEEAQKVYELGYKKGVFMSPWQRSLHNVERLAAHPWWTAKETGVEGQLKMLAENWKVIRDEGLAQLNNTTGAFELESEDLRDKGEWRQFTLYKQGHKVPENCRRTPKTCALLDQFPEATSCKRGQIKYSVMHPGIHVWPHCGPTNCRIRAHLGLVVPPGLTIRVVNETRSWIEGEFIVFDDSFDHEVWHDGNSLRLVLIVDIWHPELSARERTILPPI